MPATQSIRSTARWAGVLYLTMSLLAIYSYFVLGPRFSVRGDAVATARVILENEGLYRLHLLLGIATQVLFIGVVVALYRLFEDVDRSQARLMVALVTVGIAAVFAGMAMDFAPLVLLRGGPELAAFTRPQLEALSMALVSIGSKSGTVLTSLWGLWLLPFGVLTIRSGFLPKFLGVLLLISGIAYVVTCITAIGLPAQLPLVSKVMMPLYFGEFIVVLWLAIVPVREKPGP